MENTQVMNKYLSMLQRFTPPRVAFDAVNYQKFVENKGFRPSQSIERNIGEELSSFHKKLLAFLNYELRVKMEALTEIIRLLKEILAKLRNGGTKESKFILKDRTFIKVSEKIKIIKSSDQSKSITEKCKAKEDEKKEGILEKILKKLLDKLFDKLLDKLFDLIGKKINEKFKLGEKLNKFFNPFKGKDSKSNNDGHKDDLKKSSEKIGEKGRKASERKAKKPNSETLESPAQKGAKRAKVASKGKSTAKPAQTIKKTNGMSKLTNLFKKADGLSKVKGMAMKIAGKASKIGKFGKLGKTIGKTVSVAGKQLPLVGKVIGLASSASVIANAAPKDRGKVIAGEAGGWLGGLAGGAAAGAAAGAIFGGVGAIPGAVIGGLVGTVGGEALGKWLYNQKDNMGALLKKANLFKGSDKKDAIDPAVSATISRVASSLRIMESKVDVLSSIETNSMNQEQKRLLSVAASSRSLDLDAALYTSSETVKSSQDKEDSSGINKKGCKVLNGDNIFNITINGMNKTTDEILKDLVFKISEAVNTMGEVVFE